MVALPEPFLRWFRARGWEPRAHQLELLAKARAGRSALLIAPTGELKIADFEIITRSKSFGTALARSEFEAAGQALLAALFPVPKGIRLLGLGLHNLAEGETEPPRQLGLAI